MNYPVLVLELFSSRLLLSDNKLTPKANQWKWELTKKKFMNRGKVLFILSAAVNIECDAIEKATLEGILL